MNGLNAMAKKKSTVSNKIIFSFHLRFASKKRNVRHATKFLTEVRKNISLDDELYGNILIALTEAVNNAIVHGNKCDENKYISIRCDRYRNRLEFSITDEGQGFNPDIIPNPLAEENLMKEGGRGVHIIRTLTDRMKFKIQPGGMEIRFSIKLPPPPTRMKND